MTPSWLFYAAAAAIVLAVLGFGMAVERFVAPELRLVESWALRSQIKREAARWLRTQPLFMTPWLIVAGVLVFGQFYQSLRGWWAALTSIAVVTALMVHSRYFYRRAARRAMSAYMRCFHCGYDLTGNESGVCPECGTGIESPTSENAGHPDDRGRL